MGLSKLKALTVLLFSAFFLTVIFQNCTKTKFADPNGQMMFSSLSAGTLTINNNAAYTTSDKVIVQFDGIQSPEMYITNDPSCTSGGVWQPFSVEVPWKLGEKNKDTRVFAKFRSTYAETSCIEDSIVHDDVPPEISLANLIPKVTNANTTNFSIKTTDAGSGVNKLDCPQEVDKCYSDLSLSNSVEGNRILNFYVSDKAGNRSLPLTVSWLYDKTGPKISFNQTPASKTLSPSANFKIQAVDNFTAADAVQFKASIDGGEFKAVASTINYDVAAGNHTVTVKAYDEALNESNLISYSWQVGNKIPSIQFTETPKVHSKVAGQFAFKGYDQFGEALSKFECSLNGASFSNCTSPFVPGSLFQGENTFKVRGTDNLGLMSGELTYKWNFDNVAPVLAFVTLPSQFSKEKTEQVKISAVESGGLEYVEIILDETSVSKSLLVSTALIDLKEGLHKVKVQAKDLAGNLAAPIEYSFYSDFTAPVVNPIQIAPYLKTTNLSSPVVAADNINDPANTIKLSYQLDNIGVFAEFTSPIVLKNLTNGSHQIKVYATDKAGNQSATILSNQFIVDLIAPSLSLVNPVPAMTGLANTEVKLQVDETGSGFDKLECPVGISPCSMDMIIANVQEGQRSLDFYATDKAGNRSNPFTVTWLYDKTGPSLSFTSTPANQTNSMAAHFIVQASDNYSAAGKIKFKYSLNGGAAVDTSNDFTVNVGAGSNAIVVTAYDEMQNASSPISYNWVVGTTIPSVTFSETPASMTKLKGQFSFSGKDQFGQPVVKYECSLNGAVYSICSSPYVLNSVSEGPNSFKVRATDSLGMVSGDSVYNWTYDTVLPVVSFVSSPVLFSKNTTENAVVSVSEPNLETVEFILDNVSVGKSLSKSVSVANLSQGLHTLKAIAKDLAGNVSNPVQVQFFTDYTAPTLGSIVSPNSIGTATLSVPVPVSDNIQDSANVISLYYALDGGTTYAAFASPLKLNNLSEGTHQFKIYAVDSAGNKSEIFTSNPVLVDLSAPVINFVKQPAATVEYPSSTTINFTVADAGVGVANYQCTLTVNGAAVSQPPCAAGSDFSLTIGAVGTHVFKVKATDNLGFSSEKSVSWNAQQSYLQKSLSFTVTSVTNSKVDILLVIDNSSSMSAEQDKLSTAFGNFTNNLNSLDWRIAITTTDVTDSNGGKIIKLGSRSNSPYFIQPSTPDALEVLKRYIVTGTNGSGSEKGLTAIQEFVTRAKTSGSKEYGFYRPDSVLATIVVTDSDEAQYNSSYASANAFLNGPNGLLARIGTKPYIHHSIIALPGDEACLATSEDYGVTYYDVSSATDGTAASLCAPDYGNQLTQFASTIVSKTSAKTLDCAPADTNNDGVPNITVTYVLNGSTATQTMPSSYYTVTGNVLKFNSDITENGTYTINYSCPVQ